MEYHLDVNDDKYKKYAESILHRHATAEAEANITSAVRDFLIHTRLAQPEEIVEEMAPTDSSRQAVDLTALDTFIEFKRRIGTTVIFQPNPTHVAQLDDYLQQSQNEGKGVRTGILTDGKYWLLRWPGAQDVQTEPPYGFVLEDPDQWLLLYEWLRDIALLSLESMGQRGAVPGSPQSSVPARREYPDPALPGYRLV